MLNLIALAVFLALALLALPNAIERWLQRALRKRK